MNSQKNPKRRLRKFIRFIASPQVMLTGDSAKMVRVARRFLLTEHTEAEEAEFIAEWINWGIYTNTILEIFKALVPGYTSSNPKRETFGQWLQRRTPDDLEILAAVELPEEKPC